MIKERDENGKLTPEAIENLVKFGVALQRVYNRLRMQGYKIVDGELLSPDEQMRYNMDKHD